MFFSQVLVCGLNNYNQLGVSEVHDNVNVIYSRHNTYNHVFAGLDILHARRVAGLEQPFVGEHCHRPAPRHRPGA